MTTVSDRLRHIPFLTFPRAMALLIFVVGVGSFFFFVHTPNTSPTYDRANDRASVMVVSSNVYDGVENGPQRTGLPVPVSVTAADMRAQYAGEGWRVHVVVHGANIKVTFPKEPAVCVWVPAIVDGPKEPSIVSC